MPNPFNYKQVYKIDLQPENVDALVFWTRYPAPMMKHLDFLDSMGHNYYFQITLNNYPGSYETNAPELSKTLRSFRKLADRIGFGRVVWRYDPVLLADDIDRDFHLRNFEMLSSELSGLSKKIITSIITIYKKTQRNVKKAGKRLISYDVAKDEYQRTLKELNEIAVSKGFEMDICCPQEDMAHIGLNYARCIDDRILQNELGLLRPFKRDKNQRKNCCCVGSKDIGFNNTCIFGCRYCYATASRESALQKRKMSDRESVSQIGEYGI